MFGIGFAADQQYSDVAYVMLPVAAAILSLAGLLFWLAFRRRAARGGSPS